ncbi:MAG: transaldolase family protein [Candidatus Aenigmatarchaeota archaeon]
MDIFVDTADLDEIKEAESWGILDGVTTNPSLIKKAVDTAEGEISLKDHITEILKTVDGPVSLEVTEIEHQKMVEEAQTLYDEFNQVNDNVVVKIPVNTAMEEDDDDFEGVKAIKTLSGIGIPVNCTLVMKPNQALMAAKAGAEYVSPFLGRIDDHIRELIGLERGEDYPKGTYYPSELTERIRNSELQRRVAEKGPEDIIYRDQETMRFFEWGNDNGVLSGVDLVWSIKNILDNYSYGTEIIAASVRTSRQVRQCAEVGVEIATIPFNVIEDMMVHYKTSEGMKAFDEDVIPEYKTLLKS